jgi:hypothetical protein
MNESELSKRLLSLTSFGLEGLRELAGLGRTPSLIQSVCGLAVRGVPAHGAKPWALDSAIKEGVLVYLDALAT